MRILHVVDSLNPGGMENGVVNVANELAGRHEIGVACLSARGAFAERMPQSVLIEALGKVAGQASFAAIRNLRRLIGRWKPDVLHTHNLGALIYGGLASHLGRSVALLHGEHGMLGPDDLRRKRRWQRHLLYRSATLVHTVSGEQASHLESHGFRHRRGIRVVLNGVDGGRFHPATDPFVVREQLGVPTEALVLAIVGRLASVKRHLLLLEAFDAVKAEFPGLQLFIVGGDGGMEGRIRERVAASPNASAIHLCGHVDPLSYFQIANLLVICSESEGLANVMLEAMACGVPALIHEACGGADVITQDQDGFIRPVNSAAQLAGWLGDLLSGPSRLIHAGQAARRKIERSFLLAGMAANYEKLYEECRSLFRK